MLWEGQQVRGLAAGTACMLWEGQQVRGLAAGTACMLWEGQQVRDWLLGLLCKPTQTALASIEERAMPTFHF